MDAEKWYVARLATINLNQRGPFLSDMWRAGRKLPKLEEKLARIKLENQQLSAQLSTLMALEEYQLVLKDLREETNGVELSEEQVAHHYAEIHQ